MQPARQQAFADRYCIYIWMLMLVLYFAGISIIVSTYVDLGPSTAHLSNIEQSTANMVGNLTSLIAEINSIAATLNAIARQMNATV